MQDIRASCADGSAAYYHIMIAHLRAMPQAQLMRLHARRLLTQGQTRAQRRDAGILLHALQRQVARALGSFLLPKGGVLPRRRQQRRRLR